MNNRLNYKTVKQCLDQIKKEELNFHKNYKIGIMIEDAGHINQYPKNSIVIFRTSDDGTVTLEMPLTLDEIKENRKKGSFISTYGTLICVPKNYVKELKTKLDFIKERR